MLIQKNKFIGIWFNNRYLKLSNFKLFFIKSNISKFSDFELYLFSTVFFATLKARSEKIAVPVKYRPNKPVPARILPVPDRNRNSGRVLIKANLKIVN